MRGDIFQRRCFGFAGQEDWPMFPFFFSLSLTKAAADLQVLFHQRVESLAFNAVLKATENEDICFTWFLSIYMSACLSGGADVYDVPLGVGSRHL